MSERMKKTKSKSGEAKRCMSKLMLIACLSGCNPHQLYVGCAVIRQARVCRHTAGKGVRVEIDVLKRDDSPFPASLLELQRLFPVNAACAVYLEKA